jgi:hypothetical protein
MVERNMRNAGMRGIVVPPGSKATSRLDKFTYDPSKGSGSVVVNATRGAYRFVTGAQDSKSYQIKTPYATLGVRGTILEVVIGRSQNRCAPSAWERGRSHGV